MDKSGKFGNWKRKRCSFHNSNGHLNEDCNQQMEKSVKFKSGKKGKNGVASTVMVIQTRNATSRKGGVNVRKVMLLMVKTVENMKFLLKTVQPLSAIISRAAVTVNRGKAC